MRYALLILLTLGCSQTKTVEPTRMKTNEAKEKKAPSPAPLIPKMQGLNAHMELLIKALQDGDTAGAYEAALSVSSLAQSIMPVVDKRPKYGADFATLVGDLQSAAKAMPDAARAGGEAAAKGLRHLHDQCLRCHDQAPAAANVGVCQLTQ
jgi:hypothetical protein